MHGNLLSSAAFLERVIPQDNGCHLYTGPVVNSGYGAFGRRYLAHRYAFELAKGKIPAGAVVQHCCDNKLCVNPAHLFVGTQSKNIQDSLLRNRSGSNKLTADKVRSIRADTRKYTDIAASHGVSFSTISKVKTRQIWWYVA